MRGVAICSSSVRDPDSVKSAALSCRSSCNEAQAIGTAEWAMLLRRLTRFTNDADTAEDCLQTAFVRLEKYRLHSKVENVAGFLSRAARNIAIDEARKARVRLRTAGGVEELPENLQDERPLQDEVLMVRERLASARAVLTELPERTRAAFLMHRFTKARYREIAAELGISVSAVEKHIARASLALAKIVEQEDQRIAG